MCKGCCSLPEELLWLLHLAALECGSQITAGNLESNLAISPVWSFISFSVFSVFPSFLCLCVLGCRCVVATWCRCEWE